ncbi:MAG: hypothetical protein QXN49_03675, partial [Archaeoglobaceae archaeon]
MISRFTIITAILSLLSVLLTYFVLSSGLPISFLVYVVIIVFGIGVFAFGDVFRQFFELRELLQKKNLIVPSKNELEEIKLSLENAVEELEKNREK